MTSAWNIAEESLLVQSENSDDDGAVCQLGKAFSTEDEQIDTFHAKIDSSVDVVEAES